MLFNTMKIGILSLPRPNGKPLHETARISREIEELGHDPVPINYRRTAIGITETGRQLYQYNPAGIEMWPIEIDAVIPRIGRFTKEGVLALSALELASIPSTTTSNAVRIAKDKIETQMILDKAGIPTPRSIIPVGKLPEKSDIFLKAIQSNHRGPVIIKSAAGSHGKGVTIAESRRSGRSIIDSLPEGPFMVQEFIEPSENQRHDDIRLVVIGGQVITAMRRMAENNAEEEEFRANLSLGGKAEIYEPTQREREMAIKSAEAVGLEIAGVDIMHSFRGPMVTEVNDNLELGIENISGINIASLMAKIAVDKAITSRSIFENIDSDE